MVGSQFSPEISLAPMRVLEPNLWWGMSKELFEEKCDAPTSSFSRTRNLCDPNLHLHQDPHRRRQLDRLGYMLVCKGMVAEVGFWESQLGVLLSDC